MRGVREVKIKLLDTSYELLLLQEDFANDVGQKLQGFPIHKQNLRPLDSMKSHKFGTENKLQKTGGRNEL